MEFKELAVAIIGVFSGGLTGGISNIILLIAVLILCYRIHNYFKKKAQKDSAEQAKDDLQQMVVDNKTKDVVQRENEKALERWREKVDASREDD